MDHAIPDRRISQSVHGALQQCVRGPTPFAPFGRVGRLAETVCWRGEHDECPLNWVDLLIVIGSDWDQTDLRMLRAIEAGSGFRPGLRNRPPVMVSTFGRS